MGVSRSREDGRREVWRGGEKDLCSELFFFEVFESSTDLSRGFFFFCFLALAFVSISLLLSFGFIYSSPQNVQGPVGTEMKKFCILLSKILQMVLIHFFQTFFKHNIQTHLFSFLPLLSIFLCRLSLENKEKVR